MNNNFKHLTKRQIEVLQSIAQGCTNKKISELLGISVATVKLHVNAVLKKLEVHNRTKAALLYINDRKNNDEQ